MFYNLFIKILLVFIRILSLFFKKYKIFLKTREGIIELIQNKFSKNDPVLWFHCASLGEFEQARPLIEEVKIKYTKHKILLTFFSSSGYDIQKKYELVDCVSYIPFDLKKDINLFLDQFDLKALFLIKYEFWPELIYQINKRKIKIYSISSIFRKKQVFFKFYGFMYLKILKKITHFFVQDIESKNLLNYHQFKNTKVIGDTRLDRVLKIKNSIKKIKKISDFKSSKTCIVFGSTWDKDHDLILKKINSLKNIKIIIAPHKIDINTINQLTKKLKINYLKLSNYDSSKNSKSNLLIVDSIGLLSTIYSYADIAYVGGGMSTRGLHNTMEPAVFKIPIIIGKNYQNFNEAKDLVKAGGILSVKSTNDFNKKIDLLLSNKKKREELGEINYNYIKLNSGATKKVLNKIKI